MGIKQLLIVFQKFRQNIHSRERLIDGKKMMERKRRCKKNDLPSIGKRG